MTSQDRQATVAAVEEMVTTVPRHRSPVECRPDWTMAILDCELAWAYSQLGVPRGGALLNRGLAVLRSATEWHSIVATMYERRVRGEDPFDHFETALARLSEFERYKLGRLVQGTLVLNPVRWPGLGTEFWGGFMGMETQATQNWEFRSELKWRVLTPKEEAAPWLHLGWWQSAIALGPSRMDLPTAILRTRQMWPSVTDRWATNTHVCLSAVSFIDALLWRLVEGEDRERQKFAQQQGESRPP